jgi:hypothetical protein
MRKLLTPIVTLMVIAVLSAGCNLPLGQQDAAAIQTEAALTVAAQLTAAPAVTATLTNAPFPTLSPATATVQPVTQAPPATATTACDKGAYVSDITYPDNTTVDTGTSFTKTWQLRNDGSCSWTTSYALVFAGGDSMGGPAAQALTANVNPGQTVNVSVDLTAPATNGTYKGNWALRNASGVVFPSGFWVQIVASGGGGGAFAVTHVDMSVTGSCGAFHTAVSITTNGAGTVNYHKIFSDGGTDTLPGTMTFASAGTQSFSFDNSMSAPGTTTWIDLYIDSPNHQQFGRANYSCP